MISISVEESRLNELHDTAIAYLDQNNITVDISPLELKTGDRFFGIRFCSDKGEEWLSDEVDVDELLVWDDYTDALRELDEYVLPNIGYRIERQNIRTFQYFLQ